MQSIQELNSVTINSTPQVVNFNKIKIVCLSDQGQVLVSVKSICDGIGLDNERAIRTINADEVLGEVSSTHYIKLKGMDQARKFVFLPIYYIHGWLFQIRINNSMSEEARTALIYFKKECYKALHDYFFGSVKKQLESSRKEIQEMKKENDLLEERNRINDELKNTRKVLDHIRKQKLEEEECPTLF